MKRADRILIFDDDRLFLEAYRDILLKEGYTVETAANRATGATMLDAGEWDVVLVDNRLAGPDGPDVGVDLLTEVAVRAPGAKAIMVTAFATPESIRRAFSAGAYDYLEKTGQFSTLLRVKVANAVASVRDRHLANLRDDAAERALVELWQIVRTEADPHRKGKALEDLLVMLFRTIPGFARASSRVTNQSEEIDVVLRNESTDPFWVKEGPTSCSSARTGQSRWGGARSTSSCASSSGVTSDASWASSSRWPGSPSRHRRSSSLIAKGIPSWC